jgi:hypothetical protein
MTKTDLLRHIAQTGYNVGYGAKKHFATYDAATKAPGFISFLTFAVGVYFLLLDFTGKKFFSAACIVLGVIGLRITAWDGKRDEYSKVGRDLTALFDRLKALYFQVKADESGNLVGYEKELESIQEKYNVMGISNQMLLSDWYAHYKFFWQQQIDWIDEQLKFTLFRDKLPLSFLATVVLVVIVCIAAFISHVFSK